MLGENSPVRGRIFSNEHKNKLSQKSTGRTHKKETKIKIGKSISGDKNGNSIQLEITYVCSGENEIFGSFGEFYERFGICHKTIKKYNELGIPYKDMIIKVV